MMWNPNWPEIKDNLHPYTKPQDRCDIVNRIFHLKIQTLLYLISKGNKFSYTLSYVHGGMAKAWLTTHIFAAVANKKLRPDQIDNVITAEISNKDEEPVLYETVARHMIHGPYGTLNLNLPCINNGKCSKKFPKAFQSQTSTGDDSYPKYRRRSPHKGNHEIDIR